MHRSTTMKSFLWIVLVILFSSFRADIVDARIGSFRDDNADAYTYVDVDVDVDAGVSRILRKPVKTITIESQQDQPSLEKEQQQRREPQSVRFLLPEELADKTTPNLSGLLVGVVGDSTAFQSQSEGNDRNRQLYQEWARDERGDILWWIWLIIGLSIVLCVCLCCCTSVCCLRD
mmetsp:Transcript_25082/g.54996  ORF Transcript_25082/g.54996 Transcript_25082/m.54996 type:complete len:175 (+) Transcript_25082:263-787(+)